MSESDKSFLMKIVRWIAGITATLIVSFIIGGIIMFRAVGVLANVSENNSKGIQEVKEYHIRDMDNTYDYIREMRQDQKVIKEDIKTILKEIK